MFILCFVSFSGRENKNQYVMALFAFMVAQGFTKEIIVSFLMVGHTHEGMLRHGY